MVNVMLRVIGTLIIAIIWGYFADLRHGQVGWFVGRLVFMVAFTETLFLIGRRLRRKSKS